MSSAVLWLVPLIYLLVQEACKYLWSRAYPEILLGSPPVPTKSGYH